MQAAGLIHAQFNGRADRQITAHGGIHRHQRAHRGRLQAGVRLQDAIQDRLAVLVLADLQIHRVARGRNIIALRIHHINRRFSARDLAADDKIGLDIDIARLGLVLLILADRADVFGRVADAAHSHKLGAGLLSDVLLDLLHHRLGRGQVAGREQHELTLARRPETVHLAVGADAVHTRIGA